MSPSPISEALLSCSACGATVYPEHLERHVAGYWSGALYCSHCLLEKRNSSAVPAIPDELTTFPLEEAESVAPAPTAAAPTPPPAPAVASILNERRPPRPDAKGATRMRIFHAKLADGAVAHLDRQINEWLDQNPEVEIKFANTTVGTWEGKHAEPNLILTLFY